MPVGGQLVDNGRGCRTGGRPIDDAVGFEFAQLFRQHLVRNRRGAPLQPREVQFAVCEPVQDRQFPLAADRREGGREWTPFDPGMVTCRCLLVHAALAIASFPHRAERDKTMPDTLRTRFGGAFLWVTLLTMVALAMPSQAAPGGDPGSAQHDFDWEVGAWKTGLRRLAKPLSGSSEWVEYSGTTVVRKVLGGRANLVELRVKGSAGEIEGVSLRLFNPQTKQWSLNFASVRDGVMTEPVHGGFRDGRGEFFGQDGLDGKPIFVRFVIFKVTDESWRFEQAYSEDGGRTWETNWIAIDTRVKGD